MNGEAPLYLDYAATTPVDPRVAAAMHGCLTREGVFGNPSSAHPYGRAARASVERARTQVAALIHCRAADLLWTSGATEANNLAIFGIARSQRGRSVHLITAATEHKSVIDACRALERDGCAVTYLAPDRRGRIAPESVAAALRPDTALVSIMHANNETGVLQELQAIAAVCHARGVPLHVDAAQSAGKLVVEVAALGADLLGFTAHKLYGPKGIGALYLTPAMRAVLRPLLFGGGQERGLRPGTLPVHQIVGFGEACELAAALLPEEQPRLAALTQRLWEGLARLEGVLLNGDATHRVPGILNVSFAGIEGESLLHSLPQLALSSGSACNSDSDEPSYVLRALGRSSELAQSSLRFSLGRFTAEADIERAIAAVCHAVRRLRAAAP